MSGDFLTHSFEMLQIMKLMRQCFSCSEAFLDLLASVCNFITDTVDSQNLLKLELVIRLFLEPLSVKCTKKGCSVFSQSSVYVSVGCLSHSEHNNTDILLFCIILHSLNS